MYTFPFVRAWSYCPGINGDIKALENSTAKLSLGGDRPRQAKKGWAFQPEGLEVFMRFIWQNCMGFGLSLSTVSSKTVS